MHCCLRGYTIGRIETAAKMDETKRDRLACCLILLNRNQKCDIDYQNPLVKMTALHWASYNDDRDVVKLLLEKGAQALENTDNVTPVDVAAVCLHWSVVQVFIDDLYEKFKKEADDPNRPHTV
jgi:hypothetical protein